MKNRFDNALAIQQGACNPSGIAISLLDAIREAREENHAVLTDPACRLICHQLASLLRVEEINSSAGIYGSLIDACEQRKTGETIKLRSA